MIAAAVESRLLRRLAAFAVAPQLRAGGAEPQRGASPAVLRATAAGGGAEWEATVAALEARADAVLHAPLPSSHARETQQPRRPWVTP